MAVRVLTGFEFGTTTCWANGNAGLRLIDAVAGTPSIITTSPRTGTYALEISTSAAAENTQWTSGGALTASQTRGRAVFAIRFPSSLPGSTVTVARWNPATGSADSMNLQFNSTDNTLRISVGTGGTPATGPVVVADTWYVVELYSDVSAATHTLDWWIDGMPQSQASKSTSASTLADFMLGTPSAHTFTARYDDLVVATDTVAMTSLLGAHKVVLLTVDSCTMQGTATNYNTFTSNGTLAAWDATTAKNNTDEVPPVFGANADGWTQITVASGQWVDSNMTTYTLGAGESVGGARMLVPGWAASASTATMGFRSYNGTTETTLVANAVDVNFDNTDTATSWACVMLTLADINTQSELDALVIRAGFCTDTTPDIGVHAIYVELAVKTPIFVGQAAETDVAQPLGRLKTEQLGQAVETDSAQAITPEQGHDVAVNQASETDTAQATGRLKTEQIGQAAETDTANAVAAQRVYPVNRATETDTAGALTPAKVEQLGQAVETDSARIVTAVSTYPIGQAAETDSAGAVAAAKTEQLGQATEVDSAGAVTVAKTEQLGQASETDSAGVLGRLKTEQLGQAVEVDSASAVAAGGTRPVAQAVETDVAGDVTSAKVAAIQGASETDVAHPLGELKTAQVGTATETDSAGAVGSAKVEQLGQAVETDSAGATAPAKIEVVGQALETDAAHPLTVIGGAPEPEEVDLVTLAFIIVTGIGTCTAEELADTEGGTPDRICLAVPGEIAWDNCECGQFAQTITSDAPSNVFPIQATEVEHNACGPPLLVFTVTSSITRCAPGMDNDRHPPSCAALLTAARVLEDDREALRKSVTCCLRALREAYRVTNFAVGATQSVGPQGGCVGVNITYQFGLNYVCC